MGLRAEHGVLPTGHCDKHPCAQVLPVGESINPRVPIVVTDEEYGDADYDVFAVFGYAMYVCQALEEGVIHALTTLVFLPRELERLRRSK